MSYIFYILYKYMGFPGGSVVKNLSAYVGDVGSRYIYTYMYMFYVYSWFFLCLPVQGTQEMQVWSLGGEDTQV